MGKKNFMGKKNSKNAKNEKKCKKYKKYKKGPFLASHSILHLLYPLYYYQLFYNIYIIFIKK